MFKTDQDNSYRVSIVISKLCEEEKIDVIGCNTKANLQPLPRRRAMTVISPGCQMSGPRCRGRRRGAHRVTLASQKFLSQKPTRCRSLHLGLEEQLEQLLVGITGDTARTLKQYLGPSHA